MTEDAPDSDLLENVRRMLPPQAATAIDMPGICLAACRRSGLCRFNHKIDGAPLCAAVMTAGEQDFCSRIVDLPAATLPPRVLPVSTPASAGHFPAATRRRCGAPG